MPRRRMLDPSFCDDTEVSGLSRDERLFLIGCLRNADDEGRLNGHPAYLKSEIFMYDEDIDLDRMRQIKQAALDKMKTWRPENIWLLRPYQNSDKDFLYFPNWYEFNKPSHPTPSKLPAPAALQETPEPLQSHSRATPEPLPKSSALGQVRSGKVRIGQGNSGEVHEDFTKFFNSENDLTDFLVTTMKKNIGVGRQRALAEVGGGGGQLSPEEEAKVNSQWGIVVLEKFWGQAVGKMSSELFIGGLNALKKYPLEVVARAFVKAGRYEGGKYKKWKYIQTIIDEEMGKRGRSPPKG